MTAPVQRYVANFEVTETYERGLRLLAEDRNEDAYTVLVQEPPESPCYALAMGNAALALLRLGRMTEAQNLTLKADSHIATNGCPHPPSAVQFARNYAEALVQEGRVGEALPYFNGAAHIADEMTRRYPGFATDLEIAKAHVFNSWGGAQTHSGNLDAAIDILNAARALYQKQAAVQPVGRAHVLTNLATALRLAGRPTEAGFALLEAMDVVNADGDTEQKRRIQLGLLQLGDDSVTYADVLVGAAEEEAAHKYATAYVRRCAVAAVAAERKDVDDGLNAVKEALRLEPHLEARDQNRPKLRMTHAHLVELAGGVSADTIPILIDGASLWFEMLGYPLQETDFHAAVQSMHEHFRMLASALFGAGRVEEALVSFEAGRALSYALQIDERLVDRVRAANPFGGKAFVSTGLVAAARESIDKGEALLSIAVLPPHLVAFAISDDGVGATSIELPADLSSRASLFDAVMQIPSKLERFEGPAAIPDELGKLATQICALVGERIVRSIMPYSVLHSVPWRLLLRRAGKPWSEIRASVEFGVVLRTPENPSGATAEPSCLALGYGVAKSDTHIVDLCDEARAFAAEFSGRGVVIENATAQGVERALRASPVVLLSCHGKAIRQSDVVDLELDLADGAWRADAVFPGRVTSNIVILSACESGVYEMGWGDFPVGAGPLLLRLGARFCVVARFRLNAEFSRRFVSLLGKYLAAGQSVIDAVATVSAELEEDVNYWRELGCLEVLGRV